MTPILFRGLYQMNPFSKLPHSASVNATLPRSRSEFTEKKQDLKMIFINRAHSIRIFQRSVYGVWRNSTQPTRRQRRWKIARSHLISSKDNKELTICLIKWGDRQTETPCHAIRNRDTWNVLLVRDLLLLIELLYTIATVASIEPCLHLNWKFQKPIDQM